MVHLWLREKESEYKIPDNSHDKEYKFLLSAKKVFVELLRSFVKQGWVEEIDESNIVLCQWFYITAKTTGRHAGDTVNTRAGMSFL